MFIPAHNEVFTLTCDKSKFIACLFFVASTDEVKVRLLECKNLYPKARHYLYAYKIKNQSKSNDDGEPGAIAKGFLKILDEKKLDKTLIVVVRFLGA
ncbi:MAG: YigZ family protein [Bacilli bacterium]|nr:YigZ family protein [Bacilli bacterium]